MNFDALKNCSVLLLGKPRAFHINEFEKQLRHHHMTLITAVKIHNHAHDISMVIEGGLLNPVEQDLLEQYYFENAIPIVRTETLEQELSCRLNADTLLMSLKLTKDKVRLHGFLTNALIDDSVFIKLLKLYDFNGEGFLDTDANRDVTAALIERFYDNLEQNHNIQYISMGIVELINKSHNKELINAMASLSIVQQSLEKSSDSLMETVLLALAQHPCLAREHQMRFAKSGSKSLAVALASRDDLNTAIEAVLLHSHRDEVLTALASNVRLSPEGSRRLLETHETVIIEHAAMNEARFEIFFEQNPAVLGSNPTLSAAMYEQLLALNEHAVDLALAKNVSLPSDIAQQLFQRGNREVLQCLASNAATEESLLEQFLEAKEFHEYLAKNPALDERMIYRIYRNTNRSVLEALAANEATPLELLYELLLDMHLEPIVQQNSALNSKYQR